MSSMKKFLLIFILILIIPASTARAFSIGQSLSSLKSKVLGQVDKQCLSAATSARKNALATAKKNYQTALNQAKSSRQQSLASASSKAAKSNINQQFKKDLAQARTNLKAAEQAATSNFTKQAKTCKK